VRAVKLVFFTATSGTVVAVYVVAPFADSLRSVFAGLLLPVMIALAVVGACAAKIVLVLRRTTPFGGASSDLLAMPVLDLAALDPPVPDRAMPVVTSATRAETIASRLLTAAD
jgi:hypothetical protein